MRGLHMNTKHPARKGYANGGMVRGPGTGISDDIEADVPVGSYILPADTTKAVGPQTVAMLDGMQRASGGAPAGLRGAEVPVNLSNGEYKVSPKQVHAVGMQVLEQMKNATHTPVEGAKGLRLQQEDPTRMFFANAGAVTEEDRQRLANQTAMYVQGAQQNAATTAANAPPPAAPLEQRVSQIPTGGMPNPAPTAPPAQAPSVLQTDPQARADRETIAGVAGSVADSLGSAGRAAADVASLPIRAVAGAIDSTAVRGLRAAGVNAQYISPGLVPQGVDPSSMTPFTDQKRMQQAAPQAAATPTVQPSTPSAAGVVAPAAAASAQAASTAIPPSPADQAGATAAPAQAAAPSAGATQQVYRVGNSFSDTQSGAAAGAAPRGMPSAQNMVAADALAARSGAESTARVAATAAGLQGVTAPTVRTSANDWQTRNDLRNLQVSAESMTNNGGRFDRTRGNNPAQAAYRAGLQADTTARGAQATGDVAALNANAGLQRETIQQQGGIQRETIQQGGANTRAARGLAVDQERLGIDRSRVASENTARDVTTQGAQQIQQLRNVLLDPKATSEQRKQAETSLRAIGGKADAANRFTVVPGGQEVSPQGVAFTRPSQVIDNQTGQFIQQGAAAAPQGGPAAPASKAEYDALPKGAQYVKDGKTLIKG